MGNFEGEKTPAQDMPGHEHEHEREPMTLTFELELHKIKVNQHASLVPFSSKLLFRHIDTHTHAHTHTHTCTPDQLLCLDHYSHQ